MKKKSILLLIAATMLSSSVVCAQKYKDAYLTAEEEELRNTGSYPSGHTVKGWGMALLLSEINPNAQDALFKLGYEWGQSRVIAGYHWQSDVDASRMLAAACFARLHSCKEFLEDMEDAKEEFEKLNK